MVDGQVSYVAEKTFVSIRKVIFDNTKFICGVDLVKVDYLLMRSSWAV